MYPSAVLSKIREAAHYRPEHIRSAFSQELFGVSQCIARTSMSLYHGQKSDILRKFSWVKEITVPKNFAIIFYLSLLTKSHLIKPGSTFFDFAISMQRRIYHLSKEYSRCDVISDKYFINSLKEGTRNKRGTGSVKVFNDDTKLPKILLIFYPVVKIKTI